MSDLFRTNANDFSYCIVSIQFIYLNVRSWFNLFGMIKGGTRDKQCAGGAGKVSCSGDGVQSKSRRKGVLFWCGMWKNEIFGFRNYSRIFRIKLAINWARIVEKIKIKKKKLFSEDTLLCTSFPENFNRVVLHRKQLLVLEPRASKTCSKPSQRGSHYPRHGVQINSMPWIITPPVDSNLCVYATIIWHDL